LDHPMMNPKTGKPELAFVNEKDPTDIKFNGDFIEKQGASTKNEPLGDRVANLNKGLADRYQVRHPGEPLPPEFNLPANATAADYARADQSMQQIEGATATKEQQASVAQEHADAALEKEKGKYYTYSDADGTHVITGDKRDEHPDAEYTTVKDIAQLTGEGRAMNAVQESLNDLHRDIDQNPKIFDNAIARDVINTTTEQMNRASAGLLIAGTGGQIPLPSGIGDIINNSLQNHLGEVLDKPTERAVKDYIADYKAMKDKAMVIQMMMQNGKMGRGGQQAFSSIVDQIPAGSVPDSAAAKRQMQALQRTTDGLMGKYPESYGDYKKSKPYGGKSGANAPEKLNDQDQQLHQQLVSKTTFQGKPVVDIASDANGNTFVQAVKGGPWVNKDTGAQYK